MPADPEALAAADLELALAVAVLLARGTGDGQLDLAVLELELPARGGQQQGEHPVVLGVVAMDGEGPLRDRPRVPEVVDAAHEEGVVPLAQVLIDLWRGAALPSPEAHEPALESVQVAGGGGEPEADVAGADRAGSGPPRSRRADP